VFFSQIRVGKNGRKFKIYKFRSMCKDAEQRKKALEDQNEVNGLMFKMTNDPRVTKVGKFIRKTSLDEFPQFFNVLIGDMSLVGTRPPTEDEFIQYEGRHKKRLSLKPGLTGLWQVSGRSNVNEFEEVIKMDIEYIDQWSMLLDVKLILKTIMVMFTGRGSR
jgi:lipopolysaccharide/colanic/teichoic acid biosynthesis glycosyltransferase